MAIISEISWNDMFAGKSLPDSPARKAFREAVEAIADKARAKLPQLNTRVDKAIQAVLNGDVSIDSEGQGKIASQTNGKVEYLVGKGDCCACKDHAKAPKHLCKHVLSYHIFVRARALAREKLEALDSPTSKAEPVTPVAEAPVPAPVEPVTPVKSESAPLAQAEPVVSPVTLPEAPASVNCHILLEGRQVQVTLRDTDETRLLARLATLLQQYPVAEPPTPPPTQGTGSTTPDENPYCHMHKAVLKKFTKDGRTWYSHKTPQGQWCRGK